MYLTRAVIRNIRSISSLDWDPDDGPGWHVVLGDNGSGKSSFLRCLALALICPTEAVAARQDWNAWLRSGTDEGFVRIHFRRDARHDKFSVSGPTGYARYLRAGIQLVRVPTGAKEVELSSLRTQTNVRPDRQLWGSGSGWFSAAYWTVPAIHRWRQGSRTLVLVQSEVGTSYIGFWRECRANRGSLSMNVITVSRERSLSGWWLQSAGLLILRSGSKCASSRR
jgi:energy-coupling factor transporter ATP-binding protein EcfA2